MIIRSEDKNRGKWQLGIVEQLYEGKDNAVQAVKLRAGKTHLERPIQHLYPLELTRDHQMQTPKPPTQLSAEAPVFRPRRDAAIAAGLRIRDAVHADKL